MRTPGQIRARVPLPARFWCYSAFTAVSMLGFSTFGVISYHLEVQKAMLVGADSGPCPLHGLSGPGGPGLGCAV